MLCEHVVKVSRLARFLFIEKVTMVSRFALNSLSLSPSLLQSLGFFICTYSLACFSIFKVVFLILQVLNSYLFGLAKQLIYEKLPNDISERHVLLLDPILGTGSSFLLFVYNFFYSTWSIYGLWMLLHIKYTIEFFLKLVLGRARDEQLRIKRK